MVTEEIRQAVREVLEEENHGWRHEHGGADEIPGIMERGPRVGSGDPDTVAVGDMLVGTTTGVALVSAPGLVLVGSLPASLIAARLITAGTGITLTDNGAQGTLVISAAASGAGQFYVPFGSEAAIGEAYTP